MSRRFISGSAGKDYGQVNHLEETPSANTVAAAAKGVAQVGTNTIESGTSASSLHINPQSNLVNRRSSA